MAWKDLSQQIEDEFGELQAEQDRDAQGSMELRSIWRREKKRLQKRKELELTRFLCKTGNPLGIVRRQKQRDAQAAWERKQRVLAKEGNPAAVRRVEKQKAYTAAWRESNPGRMSELRSRYKRKQTKAYRARERTEAVIEYQRAFERARRAKAEAGDAQAAAAIEKKRAQSKAWKKANHERVLEAAKARRARLKAQAVSVPSIST